jgi:hypothetical protein
MVTSVGPFEGQSRPRNGPILSQTFSTHDPRRSRKRRRCRRLPRPPEWSGVRSCGRGSRKYGWPDFAPRALVIMLGKNVGLSSAHTQGSIFQRNGRNFARDIPTACYIELNTLRCRVGSRRRGLASRGGGGGRSMRVLRRQ